MRMAMFALLVVLTLSCARGVSNPAPTPAQPPISREGRALEEERGAAECWAHGDCACVVPHLHGAYHWSPSPKRLLAIARGYDDCGRWHEAIDYYERYLGTDPMSRSPSASASSS